MRAHAVPMGIVSGVETATLVVNSDREQKPLHFAATELTLRHRFIRHLLKALKLVAALVATIFIGRQVSHLRNWLNAMPSIARAQRDGKRGSFPVWHSPQRSANQLKPSLADWHAAPSKARGALPQRCRPVISVRRRRGAKKMPIRPPNNVPRRKLLALPMPPTAVNACEKPVPRASPLSAPSGRNDGWPLPREPPHRLPAPDADPRARPHAEAVSPGLPVPAPVPHRQD